MKNLSRIILPFVTILSLILLGPGTTSAQVNLIGMKANISSGTSDIVKWQDLDPASVSLVPTPLQGYLLATSAFDAFHGNYYIQGVTATASGLLAYNTVSDTMVFSPFTSLSNISEIDMSTGKIYTLTVPMTGSVNVNEYNILTGSTILLGVINAPGVMGMVVDATAFDSNHGILYTMLSGSNGESLCRVFVRNPVFSYSSVQPLTPSPYDNLSAFCYDNENNLLFARMSTHDAGGNYTGDRVAEINDSTGAVTQHGLLSGFFGFVVGSACFDQATGNYLMIGVDTANQYLMIVYDTHSNSFISGFVPGGVSEIACDNYYYAQAKYVLSSIAEPVTCNPIAVYPVPCTDHFMISTGAQSVNGKLTLTDISGRTCKEMVLKGNSPERVDVSSLPRGIYVAHITTGGSSVTRKVVVR